MWTLELFYYLLDAPFPSKRDELIDYAIRNGAPPRVIENLQDMDDEDEEYESVDDIWPDRESPNTYFNEDEY